MKSVGRHPLTCAALPGEDLCLLMDFLAICWIYGGVLLYLARKGESVECEICQGVGDTCQGQIRSCPPVFDTCGIVMMAGKKGFNGVDKVCARSESCAQSFTRINAGKDIAVWNVLACCTGDECKEKKLALPEVSTKLNGKQCPALVITKYQEYKEEKIKCGGDETFCFELTGNATNPLGITLEIKMKGCTTASVCDRLSQGSAYIVPLGVVGRGTCKAASVAPSNVPGLSTLFLPPIIFLLLNGCL